MRTAILLALPVRGLPGHFGAALVLSWKGDDPMMRMVAEMIAAAFGSGLSWRASIAGKEVYCPPPGLTGAQIMPAFEHFLEDNPNMAEKPYGDATVATLIEEYSCSAL